MRINRKGALEQRQRLGGPVLLHAQQTEEMQRFELLRMLRQNGSIQFFRRGELALTMELDGVPDGLRLLGLIQHRSRHCAYRAG